MNTNLKAFSGFSVARIRGALAPSVVRQSEHCTERQKAHCAFCKCSCQVRTRSRKIQDSGFCRVARRAFTLAEVLITLAIIGVVAAITIPSVIVNTNQMEFKTGLRKAVSVLNQAITLNKALTGESPYDNSDLYNYLQQNMSVMKSMNYGKEMNSVNKWFYTTDGIRYDVASQDIDNGTQRFKLHESSVSLKYYGGSSTLGNCGSYGLTHNQDSTTEPPCVITVDVNGDRKPSYPCKDDTTEFVCSSSGYVTKIADPNGRLLTDIFSIMITDQGAVPYGVVAQKAMYQAQK